MDANNMKLTPARVLPLLSLDRDRHQDDHSRVRCSTSMENKNQLNMSFVHHISTDESSEGSFHPPEAERHFDHRVHAAHMASSVAELKSASTQVLDKAVRIKFVKDFMVTIKSQKPGGKKSIEIAKKRRERKREINRMSAKRKRIRVKQELDTLEKQCRDLEAMNAGLKSEVGRLTARLQEESKMKTFYLNELSRRRVVGGQPATPQPVAAPLNLPSHASVPASGSMVQQLLEGLVRNQQEREARAAQEQQRRADLVSQLLSLAGVATAPAPTPTQQQSVTVENDQVIRSALAMFLLDRQRKSQN